MRRVLTVGRLKGHAAHARILAARARETLRDEGPRALLSRAAWWFALRLQPAPAPAVAAAPSSGIEERYARWRRRHDPAPEQLEAQRRSWPELAHRPLVSVVVPVFDPPADLLARCVESVLDQTYPELELCVANAGKDDACAALLAEAAARDARVRVTTLERNLGISGNTNAALALATGEFVALLDHDDELAPQALHAVVEALAADPELDVVYSDEDRLAPDGSRTHPFLKPDWSPELLHSFMYVGHLTVYRRSLLERLGGFRSEFDGSQDYDLILRASELTTRIGHVSQVLYHWRMTEGSAAVAGGKLDARRSNLAALADAVDRRGHPGRVVEYPWANRVEYELPERPLVSIVVPTDDDENVRGLLDALLAGTDYPALEVLLVTGRRLAAELDAEGRPGVRTVAFDEPFNFSAKCNAGAAAAHGDLLCFLNDDVEPLRPDWLDALLQYAQLPDIGGVSPKLLYADDTIQYAGLVTGVPDFVGTAFHTWRRDDGDYTNLALSVRDVSCLTGACMLVRRDVFERVGGWNEVDTPIAHSDFDLCLRIRALGLRLVYSPFAELRHVGHRARRRSGGPPAIYERIEAGVDLYMAHRWGADYAYDPYYPPGMRALLYEDEREWELLPPAPSEVAPGWAERSRVALVSHDLSRSGAPGILLEVGRALRDAGAWPAVISPVPGPLGALFAREGIPVIVDGAVLDDVARSSRLLAGFDAVIANTVHPHEALLAAAEAGKRTAMLVQEGAFGLYHVGLRPRIRDALRVADVVVFPSAQAAGYYETHRGEGGWHVIRYGISEPAEQATAGRVLPRADGRLAVLHVGSLEPRKAPHLLIDALRRLPPERAAEIDVFLVGRVIEADYVAQLEDAVSRVPNAHLLGELEREDALACIRDADVFVCASRDESGPIVVLEALALGTPVITTRVGAMPELLTDGVDAELIDVDDAEELARRLELLARDPERRRRLARAGRETYERALTPERYARELLAALAPLLARP